MTEVVTRWCHADSRYALLIKTDSEEHYKATQDFVRRLIDHTKPQTNAERIRSMSDEELAEFLCGVFDDDDDVCGKFINGYFIPCYDQYSIKEWLQQIVEGQP